MVSPSKITTYITEMCEFYAKERAFPGIKGCNQDVIEDVKEHGENLETPRQYIPRWDGDFVEVILDHAERGNVCTVQGVQLKGACATMEAVCTDKTNITPCACKCGYTIILNYEKIKKIVFVIHFCVD